MALGDIRREDVLDAIALLDDPVEGPRLLDELHFGPAKDYRLVYKGKFYDSKAVIGIAHGLGAGREYLTSRDFTGGLDSVALPLTRLGFYVDTGLLDGKAERDSGKRVKRVRHHDPISVVEYHMTGGGQPPQAVAHIDVVDTEQCGRACAAGAAPVWTKLQYTASRTSSSSMVAARVPL
jgi:hypothetical protein